MFVKEQFIGREEIIKSIDKRFQDLVEGYRQNIALLGDELIGKTWILKYLYENISNPRIVTLYFDLTQPTINIFVQRFISTLLFGFLKTKGVLLPKENLTKLINESEKYIPKTIAKINEICTSIKEGLGETTIFRDTLSLLEILNSETEQKIVVILDEFQNLESLKIRNVFQELGKKIMMQKATMYIVASSKTKKANSIIHNELSLLFGNFEIIDVTHLDNKTSFTLIKNRLKYIQIQNELVNFLINFTGGSPFYLDRITQSIYKNTLEMNSESVTPFIFIRSLEDILFNEWGVLNLKFRSYVDILNYKNKNDSLGILLLIAQGKNKTKDLATLIKKSQKDITQRLLKMQEMCLITRSASFYGINDRVFSFWLNFVYLEKLNNLSQNFEDQIRSFRRKLEQSLAEFIEISSKGITQRLHELFISFSNDLVQLDKNKILLSRFKEIKNMDFDGDLIKHGFCCQSDSDNWIIGLKDGDITEDCVHEFMHNSKKVMPKEKQIRRLIIGLDKTEVNAKLLAKEEKISTWELSHLNLLLDLYGKPRLIV